MENTSQGSHSEHIATRPIGVFDSGIGGLTVTRELAARLPQESIVYLGDTLRCPYGPRPLPEIRSFARQIAAWLACQQVKLIVIACNSATAAALEDIQRTSPVPVLGVIEPGARAAVQATTARRVGVIGTQATIDSGVYTQAIRSMDAGITVFSTATPRFVEMVEQGLRLGDSFIEDITAEASRVYIRPAFQEIARDYLNPLKRCGIDTLVLGCTHYPLLAPLISQIIGAQVQIISSAEETARDVAETLRRRGQLAPEGNQPVYRFATTSPDLTDFAALGSAILSRSVPDPEYVPIEELQALVAAYSAPAQPQTLPLPSALAS
ncbi:MAG: glutamate racemase [Coriobacteriales bacterium]|jgi:glutamate racemase|nr:glutamate racemase [Coriobacteriales bacterium]